MPSLEGLTGYIVFETHGGSRLSGYWQQKTKTRLSRVHVTPRKTLFTPSHAPVDLFSGDLGPMHVSPAFQAEENVVCNFSCRTTQLVHSRHSVSRRAVSDAGVYLQGLSSHFYLVVNPILVVSEMPGAPTRSTADNMTAVRQKVGPPRILGANPSSYFLRDIPAVNRMDMMVRAAFQGCFQAPYCSAPPLQHL